MKEEQVYWVGGMPGTASSQQHLADTPEFELAIRRTCEAAGCGYERLVSAKGPYGTWLVEIQRGGEQQRVLWNGKDKRLVLQRPLPAGGWVDPAELEVDSEDTEGFMAAVSRLLAATADQG